MLYTLFVVNIGWVLFRAPDLKSAGLYLGSMFGLTDASHVGFTTSWFLDGWNITILILAVLAASSLPKHAASLLKKHIPENALRIAKYVALLGLFYWSVVQVVSGTYNPFIYFRF